MSSIIRRRGARVKAGRYQDTIQQELDWALRDRGRPVHAAEAFATSAGGPDSELARVSKTRAVIHVATVQTVDAESRLIAYKNPQLIESSVRTALAQMAEINRTAGVFSPPDQTSGLTRNNAPQPATGNSVASSSPCWEQGKAAPDQ